ncbi:hypothetical protein ACSFVZ_20355 [Pseudoalteromonas sp. SYSU M81236]|uniref:hypothetical protein n=1 Tax=unclassified Pseudoalteromonas TaxID=194690 RepID=UPI001F1910F1|nr:hypothetical protein [Pseudoalteromonas sp. OFAV1]MCF2903296.1 hypothetical protein [Pseudoalteromonas sp. OFAV1]
MFTNRKTLLAMSVASVFALSGCSSDDDKNEVVPDPVVPPVTEIVPPDTIVTEQPDKIFSVNVIDATNADALVGAMVTFMVDGEAATSLVDPNGEELSMVTVDDSGNFTFLPKEDATGEVTAQVTFDGYVGKSFVVDLDAQVDEGSNDIPLDFALVPADSEGLASATTEVELTDATTIDPIVAVASKDGAKSDVTIPAGTTLKDANGDAVAGGAVKLNVLAADSSVSGTGLIIPDGLNENSTTEVKESLGVTNITMTAGETKVKQFTPAINVSVTLPASSGVSEGDILNVSSHNEDTGMWKDEQFKATVGAANTDGTYPASFMTDHLTFFSMNQSVPICTSGVSVKVVGGTLPARGLAVSMTSPDGSISSYIRSTTKQIISGASTARFGISSDAVAKVRLYDRAGNTWYEQENQPICGDVEVTLNNTVETFDSAVTLNGVCAADNTVNPDLSGSIVTYAKDGKAASLAQGQGNSTFSLAGLEAGGTYKVRATIRGAKVDGGGQSQTFTFENVQSTDTLTGQVSIECEEREVTGTN